ncbi:MAG: hypothetical protein KKD28_03570 [Chloroflexi bacterium]|nr:hypothetical protein [Chloroflexota bacterium]MBU1660534.1 hypothetical protein [Chloroflexota bacterium]
MSKHTSLYSIAQTLQQNDLFAFSSRTFSHLFDMNSVQVARLLTRMESEGLVARPERGKYLLLGLAPEQVLSNHLFIGNHLVTPGYVSCWSALHFYGFTEQVPQTVFICTTRKKPAITFRGVTYKFIKLKPTQFFGYRREIHADLPVLIADEAKAIIDSLHRPQYAGGVSEVAKALRNALRDIDIETLVKYANALCSRSLASRLGYLLDLLGVTVEGLEISQGPVNLEPARERGGPYDTQWRIYANLAPETLFPEGVG